MITKRFHAAQTILVLALVFCSGLFAVLPASVAAQDTGIGIKVADRVEIDSVDVRLGQLARIECADPALIEPLQDVIIGRAPQAGHARPISREYILLRLRQAGFDTRLMRIEAPDKMTVSRRAVTISKADLEMMVRDYITANPPYGDADMTISLVRISGDAVLPTGEIQHEIQYMPQSRPSGTLPLNIFFNVDGIPVKRLLATAHIVMMKDVPVTRHPIARYQMVGAEDLMMQKMDITDLPANAVLSFQDVEGQRARRNIGPRTVLRKDQLEYPPVVKKGDRVMIVAESGGLRITTLGEVKTVGRRGERIKVLNLDSNKTLFARVVDSRTVQVDF